MRGKPNGIYLVLCKSLDWVYIALDVPSEECNVEMTFILFLHYCFICTVHCWVTNRAGYQKSVICDINCVMAML